MTVARMSAGLLTTLLFIAVFARGHDALALSATDALNSLPAFHHKSWDNTDFGAVYDLQQDREGYIWLQAANGIFRFDGAKFLSVDDVTRGLVSNASGVDAVLPAASGGIWFMIRRAGLVLWKDNQIQTFHDARCTGRLSEAPDGSLWIAGSSGLFHLKRGVCEAVDQGWGTSSELPSGLLVDREGTVWVKRWSGNLMYLKLGANNFQISPYGGGATRTLSYMGEAPDGSIWLTDGHGLREVRAAGSATVPPRKAGPDHPKADLFGPFAFAKDGSVWIATEKGARWAPRPEQWATPNDMASSPGRDLTMADGLSSDVVWSILIDRENSVWMATNSGVDQVRRSDFHKVVLPHVQEHEYGIASGDSNSAWTGSESLALTHVDGNKSTMYRSVGPITCVKSASNHVLWVASKDENRLWRGTSGIFKKIHYPNEAYQPIVALAVDSRNDLWISMRQYGVFRLSKGVWIDENDALGKPKNIYGGMTDDEKGDVWFAFRQKLVEWDGIRFVTHTVPEQAQGIFGSALAAMNHHVWFSTTSGVELFANGTFHSLHFSHAELPGVISGLAETATGDLWINGFSGVTHVSKSEIAGALADSSAIVSSEHLDEVDGLPGLSGETIPKPSLIESPEGRLWFATTKGIAWLDPLEFARNRNLTPPPVIISSITSDGILHNAINGAVLPPDPQRLQISYDALSLAIPERVSFKYKLEPLDKDWQNVGTRREAIFNTLEPGQYVFRVIACNNDGVWNETGASIAFRVRPAFYQTWWFKLCLVLISVGLLWVIWSLRIQMITRSLQGRLTARLEERERIARELHDTLLQGIFGLTLRLQSSVDQLAEGHPVRADITQALNQSDAMMLKGRERIRGLRDVHLNDAGLVAVLEAHGQQLQGISVMQFQVFVEGEPRQLAAPIEEELSLIGCEALTNAFRHARASVVGLEISYGWNSLRVRISDNGKGVDPHILAAGGKKDHWGLPSMRERAQKMHARFDIGPGRINGTVVEVQVPGSIVYQTGLKNVQKFWFMLQRSGHSQRPNQN